LEQLALPKGWVLGSGDFHLRVRRPLADIFSGFYSKDSFEALTTNQLNSLSIP
jgi:hypothetical protein